MFRQRLRQANLIMEKEELEREKLEIEGRMQKLRYGAGARARVV